MDNLSLPTDDELLPVLHEFRASNAGLGHAKILDQPIKPKGPDLPLPPITYPQNALAAQQKYKDEGARCFKIYSRGPYDFKVSPNADMAIKVDIAHDRLKNIGRPKTEKDLRATGTAWPMRCLFDYYWAAAQIAGVSQEDIGRQYGVNLVPSLPFPPTPGEVETRKTQFKIESMEKLRQMLKHPEIRKLIPVDARGKPIWDETKHGEFCVLVVKIDQECGLEEFSPA